MLLNISFHKEDFYFWSFDSRIFFPIDCLSKKLFKADEKSKGSTFSISGTYLNLGGSGKGI